MNFGTRATALIAISMTTFTSIPIFLPGAEAAGRSTTALLNTILNGKGVPKSSLGIDGDFYIDTRSLLLYGPKAKGKWPTPQSIQGPTGPSGSDGKNGSDGKQSSASNVNSVSGPQGLQGPQGLPGIQGEKGEPGATGSSGSMGASGPAGAAGSIGPTGATGSNGAQGATGLTGTTGLTGNAGTAGVAGAAGVKGETGTVGPSEVTVIDIPTFTLATSTFYAYVTSSNIGVLEANKSYSFEIYLRATSSIFDGKFGLDVITSGGILKFSYSRSDFEYATYSSLIQSYGFHVSGTVQVATTEANLVVRVIDARGLTAANPLNISGKAYITLVGAIR